MPTVHIPTTLRRWTQNRAVLESPCGSLTDVLGALEATAPGLRASLYDERGHIRSYISVFVNDTDMRSLEGEQTAVGARDEVFIIPAIAGG